MALTDNIVAAWHLDEASGNASDSVGSNTLTDTNSVGSSTGKLSGARHFTRASAQKLLIADNTDLSTGDIDFTFSCWAYLDSKAGTAVIICKTDFSNGEYFIYYDVGTDRFRVDVYASGGFGGIDSVYANALGSPSTGTWYFIVAWHDSVANTINIQVNDGSVDSVSHSTGVVDSTAPFAIGADVFGDNWDGRIDEVIFWKRVLTSGERTQLYNSGAGLAYPFSGGAPASASMLTLLGVG